MTLVWDGRDHDVGAELQVNPEATRKELIVGTFIQSLEGDNRNLKNDNGAKEVGSAGSTVAKFVICMVLKLS